MSRNLIHNSIVFVYFVNFKCINVTILLIRVERQMPKTIIYLIIKLYVAVLYDASYPFPEFCV